MSRSEGRFRVTALKGNSNMSAERGTDKPTSSASARQLSDLAYRELPAVEYVMTRERSTVWKPQPFWVFSRRAPPTSSSHIGHVFTVSAIMSVRAY